MHYNTDDIKIKNIKELLPPVALLECFPISAEASGLVTATRAAIEALLNKADDRLLVVVGPCSIHDATAAMEYATKLKLVRDQYSETLEVVMRVYFEKPRTTVGWKGLINDPHMDDNCNINEGLRIGAKPALRDQRHWVTDGGGISGHDHAAIHRRFNELGGDWCQNDREPEPRKLASGLSCPVGFKNGTDGNIAIAIDAIGAASASHHFCRLPNTAMRRLSKPQGTGHAMSFCAVGRRQITAQNTSPP